MPPRAEPWRAKEAVENVQEDVQAAVEAILRGKSKEAKREIHDELERQEDEWMDFANNQINGITEETVPCDLCKRADLEKTVICECGKAFCPDCLQAKLSAELFGRLYGSYEKDKKGMLMAEPLPKYCCFRCRCITVLKEQLGLPPVPDPPSESDTSLTHVPGSSQKLCRRCGRSEAKLGKKFNTLNKGALRGERWFCHACKQLYWHDNTKRSQAKALSEKELREKFLRFSSGEETSKPAVAAPALAPAGAAAPAPAGAAAPAPARAAVPPTPATPLVKQTRRTSDVPDSPPFTDRNRKLGGDEPTPKRARVQDGEARAPHESPPAARGRGAARAQQSGAFSVGDEDTSVAAQRVHPAILFDHGEKLREAQAHLGFDLSSRKELQDGTLFEEMTRLSAKIEALGFDAVDDLIKIYRNSVNPFYRNVARYHLGRLSRCSQTTTGELRKANNGNTTTNLAISQNNSCFECGHKLIQNNFETDHHVSLCMCLAAPNRNMANDETNLRVICKTPCHTKKSAEEKTKIAEIRKKLQEFAPAEE